MSPHLPRYQLRRRSDNGWVELCTFDSVETAFTGLHPFVPPTESPPCPRFVIGIGLLFAFVVGFCVAAVLRHGGVI